MCGLAGFTGYNLDLETKTLLTWALGCGIDERGGHAAGYVSHGADGLKVAKKLGHWSTSSMRFLTSAASGDIVSCHARWKTCGNGNIKEAHPFTIRRDNKTIHGMHNGMVYNAWESARRHNRKIRVDSEEIFNLLVDNNKNGINDLDGYGVITYVEKSNPSVVNLIRLSSMSDISVVKTVDGNIVWASTRRIINDALELCNMKVECEYDVKDIGRRYIINRDGIFATDDDGYIFEGNKYDKFDTYEFGRKYLFSPAGKNKHTYSRMWEEWDEKGLLDEDPPSSEPFTVPCEHCNADVDSEEADSYASQWQEMTGRYPDVVLCDKCMWSCDGLRIG